MAVYYAADNLFKVEWSSTSHSSVPRLTPKNEGGQASFYSDRFVYGLRNRWRVPIRVV